MSRDRVLIGTALAVAAGLCVLVVVLVVWDRGGAESVAEPPIEARGVLSPEVVLFGDTVSALVEVTLDRNRIDPDSVRVRADFSPWEPIAAPQRVRRDGKTTTYLGTTFLLRCLVRSCVSTAERVVQTFPQARVTYSAPAGASTSDTLEMPWPELVVGSRYSGQDANRWRADLLSVPAVSYRVRPGLVLALLLAAATVLAIVGWGLARRAFPRRAAPAPTAEEPPAPVLTPLERALALLDDPARVDGAADQRRALEFVAWELVERGDLQLAQAARALAWSPPVPAIEKTSGLAAQARSVLGEEPDEHLA